MTATEKFINATRALSVSAARAGDAIQRLACALIFLVADTEGGEWPDKFILLNRYMRTDRLPSRIEEKRCEVA